MMAVPSRDRFKTLLRVRKRQENLRGQALALVRRLIRAGEAERTNMEAQRWAMLEKAADRMKDEFTVSDVQRYYQYERHLARLVVEKDAEIQDYKGQEEERRQELTEAMKHRRIAERLDERSEEEFAAHVRKHDRLSADEVAIGRAWMARRQTQS
jgi:flagellar export protein FliJ